MLKRARGPRPTYFDDPQIDRLLSIVLALAEEVSVMRERLDTIERLAEEKGGITRAEIESFRPDERVDAEREAMREAFLERVLRTMFEEAAALEPRGNAEDYEKIIQEVS